MAQPTDESAVKALHDAIAAIGSQSKTAKLLGITQASVSKWVTKRQALPPSYVLAVEAASGVSKHDLRPDIYPREHASVAGPFSSFAGIAR